MTSTAEHAEHLRSLHHAAKPLVLPNVWDPMGAAIVAAHGAKAVATTSGGISWAHGRPDGERLERARAVAAIRSIADTVSVPVTADIEGGYGRSPADVSRTVADVIDAGAAGINLEDTTAGAGPLLEREEQARRIAAARDAASAAGVALVINARTDVYLSGGFTDPIEEVAARADAFAAAGADCLFVPGVSDLATIETLVARCGVPLNVMVGPGAPTVSQLAAVGVRRISIGTALAQLAFTVVGRAVEELLRDGTYTALDGVRSYPELNAVVPDV